MINALPVIGWILSVGASMSMSVPFYFIWNALAPTYFYFLPPVYLHLPFWHCVGLFVILPILKVALVPSIASVSQTNSK